MGGWWRWALLNLDGVAPSLMVGVSASVNLPLHHKVQKFSSGTGSPGCSRKKGHKTVVVVVAAAAAAAAAIKYCPKSDTSLRLVDNVPVQQALQQQMDEFIG